MRSVFLVWHKFELSADENSEVLVGAYSTEPKAQAGVARAVEKPGFRDHPEGFEIAETAVDEDLWTEGFMVDEAGDLVG